MDLEHGIKCKCGQTFKTSEEQTKHVTIKEVLDEIKRIGGKKFYRLAKNWENDAHSGNLQEFAANHNLKLTPENSTQIAKKEINHMVQHYDEYCIDGYQDSKGGSE